MPQENELEKIFPLSELQKIKLNTSHGTFLKPRRPVRHAGFGNRYYCLEVCGLSVSNLCLLRMLQASIVAQLLKNLPTVQETWVQSLGWEDLLEKGMAAHSSILAWRIPWVQSLVREDSTCHRATKLRAPQVLKPTRPRAHAWQEERPLQSEPSAPQRESSLLSAPRENPLSATRTQHSQK